MKKLKDYSLNQKESGAPLSVRVPIKIRQKYINLKGFDKKEMNIKIINYLKKVLINK